MVIEIIRNGFNAIIGSFRDFQGSGLIVVLFFLGLIYIGYASKNKYIKDILVKYPVYVLIVFFCPVWYLYVYLFDDYEILYRILWLLPLGVVICYSMVEVISKASDKYKPAFFTVAVLILVVSGEYTYANRYFTLAENIYHIPDAVVDICDEISVEGREIRAAFPDELVSYVRQYTPNICLPYGRETFMGLSGWHNSLQLVLNQDEIDAERCAELLRETQTAFLVVSSEKRFTESISNYDFVYVTSIDGYDIYLDNNAYIGTDFINYR